MTAEEYLRGAPAACESAPGRVNLLGEHTDYNDGYMLPTATPQRTTVALAASTDGRHRFYSANLDQEVTLAPEERAKRAPPGFGRYIEGCIRLLEARGIRVPALRLHVVSSVPMGSGLSSSAALEVATLRALRSLLKFELDDVTLALIGQQAEIRYAGVNCGIMDQMAASLADESSMLFIDARTLEHRLLPLPTQSALVVIDSGVSRELAASRYNERRGQCEEAARLLEVRALRDVTDAAAVDALPGVLRRRARHVVLENLRVLEACRGVTAEDFGVLMNASHESLKNDFEVSIAALDELVSVLRSQSDVYGARLTGAGFGGACVALCRRGREQDIAAAALAAYNAGGHEGRILLPAPAGPPAE